MLRAHWERNIHSPLHGKSLAAGQCSCGSGKDLLKRAHPTAYGICEYTSERFSGVEEEGMLQSKESLLHHQRDRA